MEIDLSINIEKKKEDKTKYVINGIQAFIDNADIISVNKSFMIFIVKLMHAMIYYNAASEPFQDTPGEQNRVNQLHKQCLEAINKILNINATCKNNIPEYIKPKIEEAVNLISIEISKIEKSRNKLTEFKFMKFSDLYYYIKVLFTYFTQINMGFK